VRYFVDRLLVVIDQVDDLTMLDRQSHQCSAHQFAPILFLQRTRVVGAFPDGQSALNLAAARLRHIAGTAWSTKRYLNIELLKDQQMRGAITA
jgi:hypothetical protein